MRWPSFLPALLLAGTAEAVGRGFSHAVLPAAKRAARPAVMGHGGQIIERRGDAPRFLNKNTTKFAVNGTAIPDVDFDVGESYAGLLPIGKTNEKGNLFFWFFPSTNPAAKKEILIWLNGGPGCSSFMGLLQEHGPFLWQRGTFKPVRNPWSWHTLTNIVYIEQPVGTGFSTGPITITSEEELAAQFMGFWKNFVDTFGMHGYKVYISGESYAGKYCPYIASAFLDANDETYYRMSGMTIYDPSISWDVIQALVPVVPFTEYWAGFFPFNDTFRADIRRRQEECGFANLLDEYLVYPPKGEIPLDGFPGTYENGTFHEGCFDIYSNIFDAVHWLNPCFSIYQIAQTCPLLWDVLGFPATFLWLPKGAQLYFDRDDVKAAIHAPANVSWKECSDNPVFFNGSDNSLPSSLYHIPHVIDKTKNVIISHGALDMILIANGTLLTIQNMTWGGKLGFQHKPNEPFYVPYNNLTEDTVMAGAGVLGSLGSERGLTYVAVDMAGHEVPTYSPAAAYRQIEYMLGRVDCMNCTVPFTTDVGVGAVQSAESLGKGTAPPQQWSKPLLKHGKGVTDWQ